MAIVSLLGVTYGHRGPQEWIAMGINRRCGDSSSTPMTNRGGPEPSGGFALAFGDPCHLLEGEPQGSGSRQRRRRTL